MKLYPSKQLTTRQTLKGLDLVIKEGLTSEAMSTLTGGTFLMAMAILLGASNFQIGLLAALPTMTNIFQLLTIWLLQKYNNRRAIAVITNGLARLPLLLIGALPFLFSGGTSISIILFLLFFHYFFGSMAGASWNSWMKDLVPAEKLGSYFSKRTRVTQSLNLYLSLGLALVMDYVKKGYPQFELTTYSVFFITGGLLGLFGTLLLARTPEPASFLPKENLFRLFTKPLRNKNFRSFLMFHSAWSFALNIATPFFTVYMMKFLDLKISTIIAVGLFAQLAGILSVKIWGNFSDATGNKTIIRIAGPFYICSILAWPLAGMFASKTFIILTVVFINILSGMSVSGINLSLNNIAMKLAPKDEAVVYLSARSMLVAFISALSPVLGGFLADFFANRSISWHISLSGEGSDRIIRLFEIGNLEFLFIIGGILAFLSLYILKYVKEEGEVPRQVALPQIRQGFRTGMQSVVNPATLKRLALAPFHYQSMLHRKMSGRISAARRWRQEKAGAFR